MIVNEAWKRKEGNYRIIKWFYLLLIISMNNLVKYFFFFCEKGQIFNAISFFEIPWIFNSVSMNLKVWLTMNLPSCGLWWKKFDCSSGLNGWEVGDKHIMNWCLKFDWLQVPVPVKENNKQIILVNLNKKELLKYFFF